METVTSGQPELLEVRDQELRKALASLSLRRIGDFDLAELVALEDLPYLGHVIDREDELTLDVAELIGQLPEIVFAEVEAVQAPIPVGRVQVEEGLRPVEAPDDFGAGERLDLDAL